MTSATLERPSARLPVVGLFTVAIFTSAALVFTVQPLIARLVLPQLGGSPAVWNASMVFFQAALLVGYIYAHLLQKIGSLRGQMLVHLALLAVAALTLPLSISAVFGAPAVEHPTLWLLGTLAVSVGPPFAILSATAPLLQAWYARTDGQAEGASSPYAFYAASNLGSMLALLSYPILIEPLLRLDAQTGAWAAGYGVFMAFVVMLAVARWNHGGAVARPQGQAEHVRISWKDRVVWVALAAVPSGLMLGVTGHISADVASAPFLWVAPLALYLLTFVIAFQDRPVISRGVMLAGQAVFTTVALALIGLSILDLAANLVAHLAAFFFSALVCHSALAARKPHPSRLTDFYMMMSVGGVIGGAVTALAAPAIFSTVLEYPILMVLALLARPLGRGSWSRRDLVLLAPALVLTAILPLLPLGAVFVLVAGAAFLAVGAVMMTSSRTLPAAILMALLVATCLYKLASGREFTHTARSFFGVHRVAQIDVPALGGPVNTLSHGTTMHGAQPLHPDFRCRPSVYYAAQGGIGQAYRAFLAGRGPSSIGVVGLGSGAVAPYGRAGDRMRFFEIDRLVERIARDPAHFSFLSACSAAEVDVVIGDARLTLRDQAPASFDLLQLDAFSSDAIPTHLLTREAMRMYLDLLKPDGVIVLHVTNRNMDLEATVAATVTSAGGVSLIQRYRPPPGTPLAVVAANDVVVIGRDAAALRVFAGDPRWRPTRADDVRPWTDDYTNVIGPILRHFS